MTVSWAYSSPQELRQHHAGDAAEKAGDLPGDVVETQLAAVGAFQGGSLFTPENAANDAVIVYFHGGGFVAGSPETHRCVTAWLAKLTSMRVLSARYRLAPEHPFPAQQEDGGAACEMAKALCREQEACRLFLAGDSAGACVALWTLHALQAHQSARIQGAVLFYGGYGHVTGASIARYGTSENGLDSATLAIMYGRLGPAAAGPIWPKDFANTISVPTYVLGAALDAVLDDSQLLFQALPSQQPPSTFVVVEKQDHGFLKTAGRDPIAMRELSRAADWVIGLAKA